jgi:2-polyprenyl-3-methyl-5-hydroxy-6-metoxy-1,4-benzoquinol methylase
MKEKDTSICPSCASKLSKGFETWHFICQSCSYECSNLNLKIYPNALAETADYDQWADGLKVTRNKNYEQLLGALKAHKVNGTLLDIGCANGWFLEAASKSYIVAGIEPEEKLWTLSSAKGFDVKNGIFPDCLNKEDLFDIITFNDVLEHIPQIETVINSCNCHLNPAGILSINIPSSNGVFYKLSKYFYKLGIKNFFYRMWQKDTYSPHIHYFNKTNLVRILQKNNFEILEHGTLDTISVNNFSQLYNRIMSFKNKNIILNLLSVAGVLFLLPFLKIFDKDIIYIISKKK